MSAVPVNPFIVPNNDTMPALCQYLFRKNGNLYRIFQEFIPYLDFPLPQSGNLSENWIDRLPGAFTCPVEYSRIQLAREGEE